jgi:hypothetical protein
VNNAWKSKVLAENRPAPPVIYAAREIRLHGGNRALRVYDNAIVTPLAGRAPGTLLGARGPVYVSFLFRTTAASPLARPICSSQKSRVAQAISIAWSCL